MELVEHDCTAVLDTLGFLPHFSRPLSYECGHHVNLDAAIAKIEAADISCYFFDISGRVELATIAAFIAPDRDSLESGEKGVFAGFACRPSALDAALAAVLEAVQSRVTQISGAREDLSPDDYGREPMSLRKLHDRTVSLHALASRGARSCSDTEQLRRVIATIMRRGAKDIYLVPLSQSGDRVHVLRALAPGLQSATRNSVVQLDADTLVSLFGKVV
jgi:ribosomal protein S12 methylthiotransferase accessory factor